jgi:hypothetical protein
MSYLLIRGDARRIPLADKSVHMVLTSPPYYGLRDYGCAGQIGLEETPEQYVSALVDVFREVRRVLRDDGVVWLNLGDSFNSAASNQNGRGLDGKTRGGNAERGRDKMRCARDPARYRLRTDLTPNQVAFVFSEIARARDTSEVTQEGRP